MGACWRWWLLPAWPSCWFVASAAPMPLPRKGRNSSSVTRFKSRLLLLCSARGSTIPGEIPPPVTNPVYLIPAENEVGEFARGPLPRTKCPVPLCPVYWPCALIGVSQLSVRGRRAALLGRGILVWHPAPPTALGRNCRRAAHGPARRRHRGGSRVRRHPRHHHRRPPPERICRGWCRWATDVQAFTAMT